MTGASSSRPKRINLQKSRLQKANPQPLNSHRQRKRSQKKKRRSIIKKIETVKRRSGGKNLVAKEVAAKIGERRKGNDMIQLLEVDQEIARSKDLFNSSSKRSIPFLLQQLLLYTYKLD